MTLSPNQVAPPFLKRSRAKIWIRTGILAVFGTLFGVSLYRAIAAGTFQWTWALAAFLPCFAFGFQMRRLVPMQVHSATQHITLAFDRIYFVLILLLVIAKAITGRAPGLTVAADLLMCVILGLMSGRLSGICLHVRGFKLTASLCAGPRHVRSCGLTALGPVL